MDDLDSKDGPSSRSANAIDTHVGQRVRLQRMMLGLSQEKLGEHLGLTFQQVQKYEKGLNRISASKLFSLSAVLGVPVQFFFDELPSVAGSSIDGGHLTSDLLKSKDAVELVMAFERIKDQRLRRALVEQMSAVAGSVAGSGTRS